MHHTKRTAATLDTAESSSMNTNGTYTVEPVVYYVVLCNIE